MKRLLTLAAYLWVWLGMSVGADTIAFFYALDADLQGLKTVAQEAGQAIPVGSRKIQRLRLESHTVYAVKMGSGCVETAVSAQAVLARFPCDWAFSIGPAGALTDQARLSGWYRVEEYAAWQKGTAGSTGFSLSQTAGGQVDWSKLPSGELSVPLDTTNTLKLASGEVFVASGSERENIHALVQADLVDMNHFGLASACSDHRVPLFAWKVVSDLADEEASETFRDFVGRYSGDGGRALALLIQSLPANPNDPMSYPHIEQLLRETAIPPE